MFVELLLYVSGPLFIVYDCTTFHIDNVPSTQTFQTHLPCKTMPPTNYITTIYLRNYLHQVLIFWIPSMWTSTFLIYYSAVFTNLTVCTSERANASHPYHGSNEIL